MAAASGAGWRNHRGHQRHAAGGRDAGAAGDLHRDRQDHRHARRAARSAARRARRRGAGRPVGHHPARGPMLVDGAAASDDALERRARRLAGNPELRAVIQADGDVPTAGSSACSTSSRAPASRAWPSPSSPTPRRHLGNDRHERTRADARDRRRPRRRARAAATSASSTWCSRASPAGGCGASPSVAPASSRSTPARSWWWGASGGRGLRSARRWRRACTTRSRPSAPST